MHIQNNLHVDGEVSSNFCVNALNTRIFEDSGSGGMVLIDVKGTKNLVENQDVIASYEQLLDIPIKIRKNGDFGTNETLSIKVGNLDTVICHRKILSGTTSVMPDNIIKSNDVFTATYDGTQFIVEGDKFLLAGIELEDLDMIQVELGNKAPMNHASQESIYGVASFDTYGHTMASDIAPLVAGVASPGTDNGRYARGDHVHPAQTTITGNAGTATKLETPRKINDINFDGTSDITISDDTKLPLTGGTLSGELNTSAAINSTYTGENRFQGAIVVEGSTDIEAMQVRNIKASTSDLTAGVSELNTGDIYYVYE